MTGGGFAFLDKQMAERILALLPRRSFKLNREMLLVSDTEKISFSVRAVVCNWEDGKMVESLTVLTEEDVSQMHAGDLKWAPGLISNDMTPEKFRETLEVALAAREK
ncbi:MAG: hypothetical protein A3G59_02335 [Candidatus Taylorbacteria bacterium RIFCSPLOWO2_12_FULL_47_20]|uniref:Uncharacterized protein n=1 Tax=Candidatus Taylorbacteria bacterium RIFCSPLOWO2_12_FULL_47_20 TaxID=1802335 RepID=A0A1G2P875_9BACT|nr:MAG: hypothetical protein A3G59_02335 [Candidatus Taylorbacteria bacterium RIFCSPLOWO2_12_FULL_47_20]